MCWGKRGHYHCYECHKEFNHFDGFTPCFKFENGVSCGKLVPRDDVIQTGENCNKCKSARAAEEICQQNIHHQKPLVIFDRRGRAKVWNATYHADLEARKEAAREQKARQVAEKLRKGENPNSEPALEPPKGEETQSKDSSPAPPFITMRHQFNT